MVLVDGSVVLWLWHGIADLSAVQIEQYQRSFSSSEKEYLRAIKAKRRTFEYVAGHHLIRQMLEQLVPEWVAGMTVEHYRDEAPFLCGPNAERLGFNLSHSGNSVCCAMTLDCSLGLDVEMPGRRRKYAEIAEIYFSPAEAQRIAQLPSSDQEAEFYRVWTLKESLVKAKRSGLDDEGLAMTFQPGTVGSNAAWHSYSFNIAPLYFALSLSRSLSSPLTVQQYRSGLPLQRLAQPDVDYYAPEL